MLNLSIESCTRHNENAVFRRPPFRATLQAQDARQIEVLVSHAGVFNTAEIAMARALAEEALGAPDGAGYHFLMAGGEAHLEGYACYGPIPGTQQRYELYWIATVAPARTGAGAAGSYRGECPRARRHAPLCRNIHACRLCACARALPRPRIHAPRHRARLPRQRRRPRNLRQAVIVPASRRRPHQLPYASKSVSSPRKRR